MPRALHLAAARARGRRREEPARAARRHRARGRAARADVRARRPSRCAPATRRGKERQQLVRTPPDILITTPESLYLMLTSQARETLRERRDGDHRRDPRAGADRSAARTSMLSLERLDAITDTPPQRIGLSATQRPLDEIARFLGGQTDRRAAPGHDRRRRLAQAARPRGDRPGRRHDRARASPIDAPVDRRPTRSVRRREPSSIWPHVHPRLLELIRAHRTTIVFCNARRIAERLAARLNELAGEELVRAHHGSLSREQRPEVESELKAGRLRGDRRDVAASSSASTWAPSISSCSSSRRARSRAACNASAAPATRSASRARGKIFPKYRGDLLEAAVVAQRMRDGLVEEMRYPRNPLDVLAQQIVARCARSTSGTSTSCSR